MYIRILSLLLASVFASFNLVIAQCCSNGNNLLANYNPDFSALIDSIPPGFITDNVYSPIIAGSGIYSIIVSRDYGACSGTPQFDNTTGDTSGRYLWFDTDNINTTPANPGLAWIPFDPTKPIGQERLITVTPNTDYVFSCWVRDLARTPDCIGLGNAPIMGLRINGADLAQVDLAVPIGQCCPGWEYLCAAWNSGNDTTAAIVIESRTGFGFTDLGIDDVYFGTTALGFNFTLGNDTTICNGDTLQLKINLPNATYTWNNGDTTNSISVTQPGTYWIEVNQNGCIGRDSINIGLNTTSGNPFTLGNDTSYCSGSTITLTPNPLVSGFYLWQNGDTSKAITITQSGSYSLTVSNGCESFSDSINVNFNSPATVKLPNDTNICNGDTLQLIINLPNATYTWNNGNTTNSISVTQPGTYWVEVNQNGCIGKDSINVSLASILGNPFTLGNDTNYCAGSTVNLSPNPLVSGSYLWQNGDTSKGVSISQSGIYSLTVANGCQLFSDSININFNPPPTVKLPNDTNLCILEDTILLKINLPNATYNWSNGDTTNSISVTQPGTYWVEVNQNGCIGKDSINITINTFVGNPFTLGNDTNYCAGSTINLTPNPQVTGSYLWQNGDTSKAISISQSGIYSLTVSTGCQSFSDLININFNPPPTAKLPNDTTICDRNSYSLIALSENAASFLWNSGDTLNNILIVQTGNYALTVSNSCGNSADSIFVFFIKSAPKPFNNLVIDTCINATILLNAGNSSYEYVWSTGATSASIYANQAGIYFVTITNNSKCLVVDTINITQQSCNECRVYVPNAFSPNKDQNNEVFNPYFNCPVTDYSMRIFNRWGEKVFETTDVQVGWNGKYLEKEMPPNVYVYLLKATYLNNKDFSEKGSVTLIR